MTRSPRLTDEPHAGHCAACRTPLAHDQRYCISCGTRRGPLPAGVEGRLRDLRHTRPVVLPPPAAVAEPRGWQLPTPRVASLCVMAMLSFGVIAGSLTQPGGMENLARSIVVSVSPPPAQTVASANTGGGGGGGGSAGGGGPATITETVTQSAPATSTPAASGASGGTGSGGGSGTGSGAGSGSAQVSLPPIKHVFVIMLSGQGYTKSFGTTASDPYLASSLRRQGELITNYYGVAPSSLATGIALLSGQGPTQDTAANCPVFTPVAQTGSNRTQVIGNGCVYPQTTPTLLGELTDNGNTWKAYIQSIDQKTGAPAGQPTSCRHPAPGAQDPNDTAPANDPYVTWRNPFVYFSSVTTGTECAQDDVDLNQLGTDLKKASATANFSYIVPDPCHDGSDQPCAPGAPAGLAQSDAFLKTVVPEIEASPAYKQDGLIVITFDQAPQSGPTADSSSCCSQPTFPNFAGGWPTPPPPTTTAGTTSTAPTVPTTPGTTTPTTTTPATTTTGTTTPAAPTTGTTSPTTTTGTTTPATTTTGATSTGTTGTTPITSAPPTTTATGTSTAPASTTTSGSSTTTGTCTSSTTAPGTTTTTSTTTTTTSSTTTNCSSTGSPPGGGQVGALLLSRYVKAGSSDAVDTFNQFSLLKTIEDLFSLRHLGYSSDAAVPEFDSAIFNAYQG